MQLYASMSMRPELFSEQNFARTQTVCLQQGHNFWKSAPVHDTPHAATQQFWEVTLLCDSRTLPGLHSEDHLAGIMECETGQDLVAWNLTSHHSRIMRRLHDGSSQSFIFETDMFSRFLRNPLTGKTWFMQGDLLNWSTGKRDLAVTNPGNMFASVDLDSGRVTVLRDNRRGDFLPFQMTCSQDGSRMAYYDLAGNILHLTDSTGQQTNAIDMQHNFPVAFDLNATPTMFVNWGRHNVFRDSADIFDSICILDRKKVTRLVPSYHMSSMRNGLMAILTHKGRRLSLSHDAIIEISESGVPMHCFELSDIHPDRTGIWVPYSLADYNDNLALTLWNGRRSAIYQLKLQV
jgi:hypothetical protein